MTNFNSHHRASSDMSASHEFNPTQKQTDEDFALKLSAWMDGDEQVELPDFVYQEQGKQTWDLYHLIGDTLRTPELASRVDTGFQARLAEALKQEPVVLAPTALPVRNKTGLLKHYGWSSFAVAAAVAAVVWVARPFLVPELSSSRIDQVASVNAPALADSAVAHDYVAAHRQLAGPAAVRQVSFGEQK
jgi:sigma-E factor negative regulatory protein RseA